VDSDQPVFADDSTPPPEVPAEGPGAGMPLDEEPRQQPPGSFLSALPQFFVFPAILVGTLTVVYLLLRVLAGVSPATAPELLAELEAAGPHGRWQVLQSLATGLGRGTLSLEEVQSTELRRLYDHFREQGETALERSRMRQYLLLVIAHKQDSALTPLALEALAESDQDLRRMALQALAVMKDPAALPALEALLGGQSLDDRLLALGAVANLDSPRVVELLLAAQASEDTIIARNAAILLARAPHRDPRALDFLMGILDRETYSRDAALEGPERDLMDADSRAFTRENVVETFLVKACLAASELGDPATRPLLEKLREADPSMKVRSAAIDALHELGPS
jgi:hypothetical protein